jgi:hypothetical protein
MGYEKKGGLVRSTGKEKKIVVKYYWNSNSS